VNVEQASEIFHAAHEILFAMIEKLQTPHITVCRAVKSVLAVTAGWLIFLCGFYWCGIRSSKSHILWFLGMKERLILLSRC
jgi:hypothetical protein